MELRKTSLSAGAIIRDILLASEAVRKRTNKVFPIAIDEAVMPYILYRRSSLVHTPSKAGHPGADAVQIEVVCYTAAYADGVELAEAVRAALDYADGDLGPMHMRRCILVDAEEGYENDAFVQHLVFQVSI